jgi:hypothetical protein
MEMVVKLLSYSCGLTWKVKILLHSTQTFMSHLTDNMFA